MGINLSKVEVRFENLAVEADVHVGGRALPSVLNSVRNIVEVSTIFTTSSRHGAAESLNARPCAACRCRPPMRHGCLIAWHDMLF